MARLEPYFPKSHGSHVSMTGVLSVIIFISRNGLRWRDAPKENGPHKTLYNRWKRWGDKGIFAQMLMGLATDHGEEKIVMIDATHLKVHRTASSLVVKKGAQASDRPNEGRHEPLTGRAFRNEMTREEPNCMLFATARDARSTSLSPLDRSATTLARERC